MSRISAISEIVRSSQADAALLSGEVDLIYATGETALEGQCVIFADDTAVFITDGRYTEAANAQLIPKGFTVTERSSVIPAMSVVQNLLSERGVQKLLYEDDVLTVQQFAKMREQLRCELLPLSGRIAALRACKSADEVACIVKAQRIAEQALETLYGKLHEGMTEREAAALLNYEMALLGSEKPSFDTILLFGENTSRPHGVPSDRRLRRGDFVLADFGAVCCGYHSDMTRTAAFGTVTDEMRCVYETVLAAQAAAEAVAAEGIPCCEMHKAAAAVISAAGYGEYFTHALGHSVGLEIHESPVAALRCEEPLRNGVVMTDEPGIYIAGRFGVRIEDMLLIDGDTPQNLTKAPKKLRVL
ncbi:MAG: aminopeptidase P family protein [Oscillospiraceae bacterium]|nr:aminopeptidase P family protein [Oscillospiraceae bacterium]